MSAVPASAPNIDWITGVGVVVLIAAIGMVWQTVHLRQKAHDDWVLKVNFAYAGLHGKATDLFQELRAAIDAVIPPPGAPFDPGSVVEDPAPVGRIAKRAVRVLRERMRIRRQFQAFLITCSVAKWASVAFVVGVLVAILLYTFTFSMTTLWHGALYCVAVLLAFGVVVFAIYIFFQSRLQQSYEHSGSTSQGVSS